MSSTTIEEPTRPSPEPEGIGLADAQGNYRGHTRSERNRVTLWSTIAFTVMFAVWLQFGILQEPIGKEFGLTTTQIAWLVALPSLNGSVWRLLTGILADRFGGRVVMVVLMVVTAIPTIGVVFLQGSNYDCIETLNAQGLSSADLSAAISAQCTGGSAGFGTLLLFAFLIGLAGNSFTIGTSWNSAWFPKNNQGLALGIFGAGNVGASVTKLIAPTLLAAIPGIGWLAGMGLDNWRLVPIIYAIVLILCAALVWFLTPSPDLKPGARTPVVEQLKPLRFVRVWRFSLYYVVVFGAYVALSGWMPKFYRTEYPELSLAVAGLLTALFIFPASLLRPLGGWLSDRYGARPILTMSFVLMIVTCFGMMFQMPAAPFTILLVLLGVGMGVGKAAVYKHIPEYFPKDVGSVGGLVGMIGGLGAVAFPPIFAYVDEWFDGIDLQAATFGTLLVVVVITTLWMEIVIMRQKRSGSDPYSLQREAAQAVR
ncbi:MAG: NarK/NasA family nitrate transporter [Propionibacteriaceae bacterium]|jgi:NNP family nitrate/nitrite transporter-like MFS transporter|nr:NarK/NasA family nitrate transporter [Propionibacteriaceae bacterium]